MILELYADSYVKQFSGLRHPFWNYEDGCVLTAIQNLYDVTQNEWYVNVAEQFLEEFIREDGSIAHYDPGEYSLDKIPSGRSLFFLYEKTGNQKYRKAIESLMNQLRCQPRTGSGSFWHKGIYPYQIWLDGLYMAQPFYLLYEKNLNHGKNYDDIMNQFENARTYLYDAKTGLYHHVYDEKKCQFWADKVTGLSPNFWSRAIGWFLMALVDCYEIFLEKESVFCRRLAELLKEAVDGLHPYRDERTGKLYQLTCLKDQPGNYLETSSSAMLSYALLKGYRLGILKVYHVKWALQILCAIEQENFRMEGEVIHLTDICAGAGLGPADRPERDGSIVYYLKEPRVEDEQKGVAAVLMAYSEWQKTKLVCSEWKNWMRAGLRDVYWMRHAPGATGRV